jgi:ATP-dependent exoDNAse (exonuclease V) beta subunit
VDAVCALFDAASRAEQRSGHSGVRNFLEQIAAQQVPASTLTERGVRPQAVRLLTAHRAKGLEWRLVVVAGVQEGSWPDLRRRGTLLDANRLGSDGLVPPLPLTAALAAERRLFYVAVTRARERLVVTAVASGEPDGDQPSRFLAELGVAVTALSGRPARPLTLAGLIAELRRTCADPAASLALRRAAAARLARLAEQRDSTGAALAPHADPSAWWGLAEITQAPAPVRPADEPVALSGSAVSGLVGCPLRWFLASEAAGQSPRTAASSLGSIVHALADEAVRGQCPPDAEAMMTRAADVWTGLRFEAPWIGERERLEARAALQRFVTWHTTRRGRRVVASEVPFRVEVPLGADRAVVSGAIDRIELDPSGGVVVVDLKAGAELVQLRHDARGLPKVQRQEAPPADESTRAELQLAQAVATIRAEHFPARPSAGCRTCDFTALCPAQQSPAAQAPAQQAPSRSAPTAAGLR